MSDDRHEGSVEVESLTDQQLFALDTQGFVVVPAVL
jgi:hypothetical protein